jgi:hypothetical protein
MTPAQIKQNLQNEKRDIEVSLRKMAEMKPGFQSVDIAVTDGIVNNTKSLIDIYKSYDFYFSQVYSNLLTLKAVLNTMFINVLKYSKSESRTVPEVIEAANDYEKGVSNYYDLLNLQMVNGTFTVTDVKVTVVGVDDPNSDGQRMFNGIKVDTTNRRFQPVDAQNPPVTGKSYTYGDTIFDDFVFTFNTDMNSRIYYIKNLNMQADNIYGRDDSFTYGVSASYMPLPSVITNLSDIELKTLRDDIQIMISNINNKAYEAESNSGLAKSLITNSLGSISLFTNNRKELVADKVGDLQEMLKYEKSLNPHDVF